jgi:hypothetical protein
MEPINFIYWLQGYLEIQDPKAIDSEKVQIIKEHLALVLQKKTQKHYGCKSLEEMTKDKAIEIMFDPTTIPYSC